MKNIVFVLGFQRSGISVLGSCLQILGCNTSAGNTSIDPGAITTLLFQDLDHDPLMVGELSENLQHSKAASKAKQRIKALLSSSDLGQPHYIFSAPGMIRTMPLWLDVLEEINIEPKIIHILRPLRDKHISRIIAF